jgi:hypothetical protein
MELGVLDRWVQLANQGNSGEASRTTSGSELPAASK